MKESAHSFSEIFWGFHVLGFMAASIGVVVIWLGIGEFDSFLRLEYVEVGLPLLLLLSLPVDTYDILFIEQRKPRRVVTYTILVSIVQAAGLIYLLISGYHMGLVVLYFVVIYFLRWFHLLIASRGNEQISIKQAWTFALFALPLVLHALFSGFTDYVDGWLIKSFFDDAEFAKYRYGARELPLNSILIGAVVSGLILHQVHVAKAMKSEIIKILRLLTPILAILILISPWLFQFFYSEDYKISALYFNLYGLLILSHVLFVQLFFYRADDRWLLTLLSFIEVVCNVGLSLFLLEKIGIMGIPIATLVIDFIFRIGMMGLIKKLYGQRLDEYYPLKTHLMCSAILIVCFIASYYWHFK